MFHPLIGFSGGFIHWLDFREVSSTDWIFGRFHPLIGLSGGFIPRLDCREVYIHWLDCHEVSSPDWIVGTFHPLIGLSGFLIPINLCYWCRINSFDIYFNHLVVESSYFKNIVKSWFVSKVLLTWDLICDVISKLTSTWPLSSSVTHSYHAPITLYSSPAGQRTE